MWRLVSSVAALREKQYSFNIWMFSSLRRRSGEQEVMDCPGDKGYYWPHIHCQHPLMQIYAAETPPPPPESELTREAPEEAPPTRHRALPGGLSILTRLIPHCWGKTGLDWAVITTYTELNSFSIGTHWPVALCYSWLMLGDKMSNQKCNFSLAPSGAGSRRRSFIHYEECVLCLLIIIIFGYLVKYLIFWESPHNLLRIY